jgi:hypothetical protein
MAISDKDFKAYTERAHFTPEEIALAEQALKFQSQGVAITKEHEVILGRLYAQRTKNLDQLNTELQLSRDLIEAEKQRVTGATDHAQILAQNRNLRQGEADMVRRQIQALEQKVDLGAKSMSMTENETSQLRHQIVALRQMHQILTSNANAHDSIEQGTRSVLKTSLGISNAWTGTLTGGMVRAAATGDSMSEGFATMGRTVKDTIFSIEGLGNIAFSLLQKVQEMTIRNIKAGDTLNAQYARATGLITENANSTSMFSSELQRNVYQMTDLYATMEDINRARTGLAVSSSKFVNMSEAERLAMQRLGVMLDKAGYGLDFLSKNLDTFSIGMGMSGAQIERFTRNMVQMGQQIGITAQQMSRDFAPALKVAIHYTGRETEVLNGLMRQAKATGLEMNKLLGVVARYDTFEGAGEAVGRLNAILGGPYLNAIQMVYATEDQRLELLRQSVSASGRNFADLDKYNQKAIMAAAGINDINTALQLFGQGAAAYNVHIQNQKSLEELARKATPVFQQLAATGQRLAIAFQPFVTMLEGISKMLAFIIPKNAALGSAAIIGITTALGAAYIAGKRWIKNKLQARMGTMNLNASLRTQVRELNRIALGWRRVGNYSNRAMNQQSAAIIQMGQAQAAARAAGGRPGPAGPGGGPPIIARGGGKPGAGGMGKGGMAAMIAGMVAMAVAPMIGRALTDDRKKQRQVSGVVSGAAGGAMIGASIGSIIPGVGTGIGAAIGGVGGGIHGYVTAHRGIYGGPVPGPRGKERMVKAQGGEMVVQPEQLAALARGAGDPGLSQAVQGLQGIVGKLGSQISNLGFTVNNLLGMGKEKNDLYVTVNMDSDQVTHQVVTNLESNPVYGLAV